MAVISVERHWNGATGRIDTGRTYEAHYKVMTDDALDGPRVIIAHFENTSGLPFPPHDAYNYANDSDPDAYCNSIDPKREPGSAFQWTVVVGFATVGTEETKPDENGNPTNNPFDWANSCDIGNATVSEPAESALYLGAFTVDGNEIETPLLEKNKRIQLQAANGRPLVPVPDALIARKVIRFGVVLDTYPMNLDALLFNTVNDSKFTLFLPRSQDLVCEKYTTWISDFGGGLFFQNGFYWKVNVEIQWDRRTWVRKHVNKGSEARIGTSSSTYAKGVPFSSSGDATTWDASALSLLDQAGIPRTRVITDYAGRPVGSAVPLNGEGGVAGVDGGGIPVPTILLHYLLQETADHAKLRVQDGGFI